jgi:hypothetical protein
MNIHVLVGFGRACAPVRCAHPFFCLINTPKGALRDPTPSIAASLLLIHPPEIKITYFQKQNAY